MMWVYKISCDGHSFIPLTEAPAAMLADAASAPPEAHGDGSHGSIPLDAFREQARIILSLKQRGLLP